MKQRLARRLLDRAQAHWPQALGATLLWCAMLPLAGHGRAAAPPPAAAHGAAEWPLEWRGRALRPLARSPVEARFGASFPGRIARFALADSGEELVLRDVERPTRMLHPAADCWRGIGWRVDTAHLERDERATLWRCFEAAPPGHAGARVRVCERIVDANGVAFTDTSAWFWAAALGHSTGPWLAVTHVQGLGS